MNLKMRELLKVRRKGEEKSRECGKRVQLKRVSMKYLSDFDIKKILWNRFKNWKGAGQKFKRID